MNKRKSNGEPFYKNWKFWGIIALVVVFSVAVFAKKPAEENGEVSSEVSTIADYSEKDAKQAYEELTADGYEVKFVFDRNNNGGFTEQDFQDFMFEEIKSDGYGEMPFTVTKQTNSGDKITLYVDYTSSVEANKEAEVREARLEEKLGVVESMTACELYGEQNYREFKIHSILGKIAEYAKDDNTWLLKYTVDANGYENLTMECTVTGTTANPIVDSFVVY